MAQVVGTTEQAIGSNTLSCGRTDPDGLNTLLPANSGWELNRARFHQ